MPKWFWILVSVILSSGIYFSIRYGLRPKPIPLMKPTSFVSLEEMGVVTFRRLYQPLRSERLVVLGYDPANPDSILVWRGLFKAAKESGVRVQKIFHLENTELPEYFNQFQLTSFDMNSDLSEIKKELVQARKRNGTIFFIVPSLLATHLNRQSITKKLEASRLGPVFSLSQFPLELSDETIEKLSDSCIELNPEDEINRIHCITFKYVKSLSRRKLDLTKMMGAIERYGLKEYLSFVYLPPSEAPATPIE